MTDNSRQAEIWQLAPTYTLQTLDLYNWGGFGGPHRALIDSQGTAIIGPTGSGKTTLVDALMTLLTANPKYNLASTGGHESDRDLVSYVRGVSGPGDGGEGQSHIARPGRTVTGLAATLHNGEKLVRIGVVLWFDGSSSSRTDMRKLWFFSTSGQQTLERWLTLQHEGGMRALKQLDKTETEIWTYTSNKAYLARVRDFFEVRENAFNLLNRAAGLKQLNSIDEIFRELVLDDTSQFERAREVADSFDDLSAIHEELEIARRQQRSLEPVKTAWEKYETNEKDLFETNRLQDLLSVWFGEQAYQLWKSEHKRLELEFEQAEEAKESIQKEHGSKEQSRDKLKEAYLRLGGSDIQTLEELISEKRKNLVRCQSHAEQYLKLTRQLDLTCQLDHQTFLANRKIADQRLQQVAEQWEEESQRVFEHGVQERHARDKLKILKEELDDVQRNPGSNIEKKFREFRLALAHQLGLSEDRLPFVAELVQVKDEEQKWRGAIERAIGGHRLRILVPPEFSRDALRWVNQRHNALHVRILEVKEPDRQPHFMADGFTRKLLYKDHPYREAVKELMAGIDRHCVSSPDELRDTPHSMTSQGLMSGRAQFFDKQDQRRLDEDHMTGFDNRDRLSYLAGKINEAKAHQREAEERLEKVKSRVASIEQNRMLFQRLQDLEFDLIDIEMAERELGEQEEKLLSLTAPDSDVSAAKLALERAQEELAELDKARTKSIEECADLRKNVTLAEVNKDRAYRKAEPGMKEDQRKLAQDHFPEVSPEQLSGVSDIERETADSLRSRSDSLKDKRARLDRELAKSMSDAQHEDRGALSEVGRELEDVPQYLERLKILTEEALPEKRQRFKEYLNRSSDEGVTQLLITIESEVERIEEKLEDVNNTLRRVDFQPGHYLQLVSNKVIHESLRSFNAARAKLASSRFAEDDGESQYKALQHIVVLLRDACDRHRTLGAKALLDPRFRLEFKVSVIDRSDGHVIETRSGSQGGSGGEKEIIASYVLTASLSYALCPDGSNRPLFGTIVLDEAFSRSSNAVAGRIIAALKEFGLHALFITPNKEMRLLRRHTRSAIVVHRRGAESNLTPLSWKELDHLHKQRMDSSYEIAG